MGKRQQQTNQKKGGTTTPHSPTTTTTSTSNPTTPERSTTRTRSPSPTLSTTSDSDFMDAEQSSQLGDEQEEREEGEQEIDSPSTPTRSRSPQLEHQPSQSESTILGSTTEERENEKEEKVLDVHSPPLVVNSSTSTYEKPKRPFSLSSEPDTPTTTSTSIPPPQTPKTPSPTKKPPPQTPTTPNGGRGMGTMGQSPSLTTQVWRNSMGLPPSPVASLGFHHYNNSITSPTTTTTSNLTPKMTGGGLVDVDLNGNNVGGENEDVEEGGEGSSPNRKQQGRISTRLDFEGPGQQPVSTTTTSASESLAASFARVREQSATKGEGGEDETVDWDFWGKVMSDYEEVARTQPKELSRAIQRGIPPALRGMTWQLMAAAKDPTLESVYQDLLKQTSPHEKSIARDLSRTFPKHEYFMDEAGVGQENLFNVVKAYSLYDEEVGYTQGLQFIVGPLLLNMPDEETFCVLVRLMKSYDLRSHYTPNMPGLQLRLFQFDRLVEELLPGVFLHMLRQGVKSSMYASQWFLTLFGYRFPLELVSAVFDLVFAEGVEAIFRFAIALIKRNEDVLIKLEFEDLIEFLKNGLFEVYAPTEEDKAENPDALYRVRDFVREALQVRITPLMLDQFGEEWSTLLAAQTAHTAELDALRKANLQLSLQVRQLEASLSAINLEHCDLVQQVVKSRLEREELEDELVRYKIAFANAEFKAASDRASMSPLSLRRQSELSIASAASSFNGTGSSSDSAGH